MCWPASVSQARAVRTGLLFKSTPFRSHIFSPHIYVDAFLNDSLPVRLVYDCAAPFVWLDSTFVDNHYGKDVIGYFGFGLLQHMGEVVIDFPNQVVYFKPRA